MSHVIVVYAGPNYGGSRRVAVPLHSPVSLWGGAFASLERLTDLADAVSRTYGLHGSNSGRYAVHRWLGDPSGPSDYSAVPDASLLSHPVYIPFGSGDIAPFALNATASVPTAAPTHVYTYPIDPSLPIELEDGTPCRFLNLSGGRDIRVEYLAPPTGNSPSRARGPWWHNLDTGHWNGCSDYQRIRNVAGSAAQPDPASAVAPAPISTSVTFEVRAGLIGTDRDTWGTIAEGFESGKEAAAYVAERKAEFSAIGKALYVKKVEAGSTSSVDWRSREAQRLADGTYTPLPGDWEYTIRRAYPDHFAHIASSDKHKVAFTESESSGQRDRQKVLSAAEYAKRYFSSGTDYSRYWNSEHRRSFIADMSGASTSVLFAPLGDEEALCRIYLECDESEQGSVSSCMTHHPSNYANNQMPVRVYALGGDITLAFLRTYSEDERDTFDEEDAPGEGMPNPDATWDGEGDIVARCLVYPKALEYGRVYGAPYAARMLRTALEAQGYTSGELMGARIAHVPLEDCGAYAVQMPYLDIGNGTFSRHHDAPEKFFVVGGDEYTGNGTNGVAYAAEMVECERCNNEVPGDQLSDVHVDRYNVEQWCSRCRDDYASTVFADGDRDQYISVPYDDTISYRHAGRRYGEHYPSWALEANGGDLPGHEIDGTWYEDSFVCEDCDETFHGSERSSDCEDVCIECQAEREASEEAEAEADSDDSNDAIAA